MFTRYDLIAQVIRDNNIKRVVVTRKQFEEGIKPIYVRQTNDCESGSIIFEFFEIENEDK